MNENNISGKWEFKCRIRIQISLNRLWKMALCVIILSIPQKLMNNTCNSQNSASLKSAVQGLFNRLLREMQSTLNSRPWSCFFVCMQIHINLFMNKRKVPFYSKMSRELMIDKVLKSKCLKNNYLFGQEIVYKPSHCKSLERFFHLCDWSINKHFSYHTVH